MNADLATWMIKVSEMTTRVTIKLKSLRRIHERLMSAHRMISDFATISPSMAADCKIEMGKINRVSQDVKWAISEADQAHTARTADRVL